MNDDRDLERKVSSTYGEIAPAREPHGLLDHVLLTTGQTRQRPAWLAYLKEPPMRHSSQLAVGSPTFRIATIMVATLLLALMVAGAGVAGARLLAADGPIVVDPSGSGDYTTIAEAVAAAVDGDTILVRPGTYDESIVLDKDVTIRGDGDRDEVVVELTAELGGPYSNWTADLDPNVPTAFLLIDSDATLENLTVRGDGSRILVRGGAPTLHDLVLDGLGKMCCDAGHSFEPTGLVFADESSATLRNNVIGEMDTVFILGAVPTVSGNSFSGGGIWMQGSGVDPVIRDNTMDGISDLAIWGGARPTVEGNTITDTLDGIAIEETGWNIVDTGTDPVIRDNAISGTTNAAITVDSSASATIEQNRLADNGTGISVGSGADATIKGNQLTDNSTGIQTVNSDAALVGNTVSGGRVGISIIGGSLTLESNEVDGAERGLVIGVGTTSTLTGNTVCGNEINLVVNEGVEMPDTTGNEICEDTPAE